MAGERIIRLLQQASQNAVSSNAVPDLIYGEVLSVEPLEIKVDSRYIITDEFIVLSGLCIEKRINDEPTGQLLWRGLQIGDSVRMLRVQEGQLFYVIEREGGFTIT